MNYTDTYAPVVNLRTIRCLFALAAYLDLEVHHMDVTTAFLNAELPEDERAYMQLPPGYQKEDGSTMALLLQKSLYGLKQAPRLWHQDLHRTVTSADFPLKLRKSWADECLYVGKNMAITLYVDDLLLFSLGTDLIMKVKDALMANYDMKYLGEVKKFLGIRVTRDRSRKLIRLNQEEYIQSILEKFGFVNVKTRATPLPPNIQLSKASDSVNQMPLTAEEANLYRSMLGSSGYAALGTRPDLTYTVGKLGQYSSCPTEEHWQAMDWHFRYLAGTKDLGLEYDGNVFHFHGFSNADWAQTFGEPQHARKSTSGYTYQLCNASISWSSKLQSTVATSSTEAEVIASNHAGKEGVWLRKLLKDLQLLSNDPILQNKQETTTLYVDNTSSMVISSEPGNQQRTKHYDVAYFWIRERLQRGELVLVYKPTEDMTADIFTKSLPKPAHNRHVHELGLRVEPKL